MRRALQRGLREFHGDTSGAAQAFEFVLVMAAIVLPLIALMNGLLKAALTEFEGLTMTLLASPFF